MIKENLFIFADFIRKLVKSRYMLWMLTMRDFKTKYAGSVFGFAWAVLHPLLLVAIYGVVFGVFFRSTTDPVYGANSFLLFLLSGLVPWQFFSEAVSSSSDVILSNSSLIKKSVGFPSEILPVTTVVSKVICHMITLILLFILLIIYGIRPGPISLFIFVYMFFMSIFAIGIGWFLSSITVFLRDTQQLIGLVIMCWFFLTPIVYAPSIVPGGLPLFILKLNPMFHAVEGYRLALLADRALPWKDLAYMGIASFITFGVGGIFYRKLKPWFAEVL